MPIGKLSIPTEANKLTILQIHSLQLGSPGDPSLRSMTTEGVKKQALEYWDQERESARIVV